MFAPIASGPIAAGYTAQTDPSIVAAGELTFINAGAITAKVAVGGSSTLTLIGSASMQEASASSVIHSLLGWGPIGSGPLGAASSIISVPSGLSASADGSIAFTGTASVAVKIKLAAPDVYISPYVVTAGDASATIVAYPTPPTTPDWEIVAESPGFRIIDYPLSTGGVPSLPFLDFVGSATIGALSGIYGASTLSLTGSGGVAVKAQVQGGSIFNLLGLASIGVASGLAGSSTLTLTGSASMIVLPGGGRRVTGAGTISFTGSGVIGRFGLLQGSDTFQLLGQAYASVRVTAQAGGLLSLNGSGAIVKPAGARVALPSQSANRGRILSPQIIGTIED